MIITLMGNDGSGKTTIAKRLVEILKHSGLKTKYIHEYDYTILKLFFKILGETRLEKSRKQFIVEKQKGWYYLWPMLVWLDRLFHYIYLKSFQRNTVVILDRYAYDHYLSFLYSNHITRVSEWFYQKFPKPDMGIVLWVEPETAYNRKNKPMTFQLNIMIIKPKDILKWQKILTFH